MSNREHKQNRLQGSDGAPAHAGSGDPLCCSSGLNDLRPRTNPEAVIAGITFVMSAWRDGHWADFNLPSGESDVWVTAYILARLGEIPSEYISFSIRQKIEDALDWLMENRGNDGGWGCHSKSESDADSTAWVVLALRRHRRCAPVEALEFIRSCRRPDGGIAGYPADTFMGKASRLSAPDVTAVAISALGEPDPAAVSFLSSCWLQTNKPLPSFRLCSRYYTCSEVVDWVTEMAPWSLLNKLSDLMSFYDAENPFEQALLLRCLTQLRIQKAWSVAANLRRTQEADGGWPASALLCPATAMGSEGGLVYLDHKRIFTTVTAASALLAVGTQPGLYFGSDRPLPQRLTLETIKQ